MVRGRADGVIWLVRVEVVWGVWVAKVVGTVRVTEARFLDNFIALSIPL